MNSQYLGQFSLLRPISLALLEEIEYSDIILEAHAKIQGIPHDIVLVDDLIMVYCDKVKDSLPLGYARLDSSLKFQRIFSTKSFSERELKGFKLLNDFNESTTFLIEFSNITSLWILHLSKVINETGFNSLYKPIRILGKGGSATVYEIARLDDGKRFAAKVYSKADIKNNRSKMNCFMNQLEIMRSIEHPNLLKLEGVFESQHSFYIIMQILGGGNLFQYLLKRPSLSIEDIKDLMRKILKGLSQLQANGIIHRDIKLENLMMRDKHTLQPVIVDFGLAVDEDDQDYIYYQCGTAGYISPQVLTLKRGDKLTPKTDIFSAGVLLHILLTRRYLFEGKSQKEISQSNKKMSFDFTKPFYETCDKGLMDLMKGMLQKDPKDRFSASQCLRHASLSQPQVSYIDQKFQLSPLTSRADYHF